MVKAKTQVPWRADELKEVDEALRRITLRPKLAARVPERPLRNLMVAIDGTPSSKDAVLWAKEIRDATNAKVHLVTVAGPGAKPDVHGQWAQRSKALEASTLTEAKAALEAAARPLEEGGAKVVGILRRGFPTTEIVAAAETKSADLIIVGSHGHEKLERLMLGSVADAVKNHARSSVLIAKGTPGSGPVVIPVDGSVQSLAAVRLGLDLAHAWRVEAQVLHVFEPPVYYDPDDGRDEFRVLLDEFEMPQKPAGVRYMLDIGHPAKRILEYVREARPRLVVMGNRGLSGLRSLVAGSVSNRVAHEANVSVLLVKP